MVNSNCEKLRDLSNGATEIKVVKDIFKLQRSDNTRPRISRERRIRFSYSEMKFTL